ncbi:hypothetical protein BDP27DRAFT_1320915, partial [Rhodocollybia butyracea]
LTNEILLHIFEYVCEKNLVQRYPWFSSWPPPIELTSPAITYMPTMAVSSVCSRWRMLALSSPSLWANIGVVMPSPLDGTKSFIGFADAVAQYLERSGDWPLRFMLHIHDTHYNTEQSFFTSLTQHAHRWKTFAYSGSHSLTDHMTLSELQFPLLEELDIVTWERQEMSLCALATSEVHTSKAPYHQLRHLKLLYSDSRFMEILHKCPSVESLELDDLETYDPEHSAHYTSHNITSLSLKSKYDLKSYFLCFDLPSLNVIVIDGHEGASDNWPTEPFITFISRSSCMISTFTLRNVSLSDSDLITALQVMRSLLHLEVQIEDKWGHAQYSPITSNLISSLIQYESTSILLVPKLHTLHLVSQHDTGKFDDSAFVRMVESRWFRPGSDRCAAMSMMGRSYIRSVVLKFNWRELDAEVYKPLRILDNEGLRVVVAGTNGIQV